MLSATETAAFTRYNPQRPIVRTERTLVSLIIPQRLAHGFYEEASVSAASFVARLWRTEQKHETCVPEPAKLVANKVRCNCICTTYNCSEHVDIDLENVLAAILH